MRHAEENVDKWKMAQLLTPGEAKCFSGKWSYFIILHRCEEYLFGQNNLNSEYPSNDDTGI